MDLIKLKKVSKIYKMGDNTQYALDHIDLTIYNGDLLTIIGPSGSGKSTLLNIIGAIDRPSEGQILFKNQDITHYNDKKLTLYRRLHIGFIFQFYNLLPTLTAIENIEVATEISTNPLDPREMLELVGIGNYYNHFPSQLSGGQQQRVAIARALASNPDILLCDEPTGALDSKMSEKIIEVLLKINSEMKKTIAIVTHNETIGKLGHRKVEVRDGNII